MDSRHASVHDGLMDITGKWVFVLNFACKFKFMYIIGVFSRLFVSVFLNVENESFLLVVKKKNMSTV